MQREERAWVAVACFMLAAGSYWALGVLTAAVAPDVLRPAFSDPAIGFAWGASNVAVFAGAIPLRERLAVLLRHGAFPLVGAAVYLAGSLLLASPGGLPIQILGCILAGAGYAGLFFSLIPFLHRVHGWNRRVIVLSTSMAVAFLELAITDSLLCSNEIVLLVALTAVTGLFSLVTNLLVARGDTVPGTDAALGSEALSAGIPSDSGVSSGRLPVSLLVSFAALSAPMPLFVSYLSAGGLDISWSLVFMFALLLTLSAWAASALLSKHSLNSRVYTLCFVSLLFLGMLILMLLEETSITGAFIYAGEYLFRAFIFSTVGQGAAKTLPTTLREFTVANLTVLAGGLFGQLIGGMAPGAGNSFMLLSIIAIYAVFVGGFCLMSKESAALFSNASEERDGVRTTAPSDDRKKGREETRVEHTPSDVDRSHYLETLCGPAIDRFGLSEREVSIVVELLRGMGVATIADSLRISQNTVKSHMNRIYKKMGVHSREELAMAVEKEARRSGRRGD